MRMLRLPLVLCLTAFLLGSCAQNVNIPSNETVTENFLDTIYGGRARLIKGQPARTLYKIQNDKACIKVLGEPQTYQREMVAAAAQRYDIPNHLSVEVGDCNAGMRLLVLFIPSEVNNAGVDQILDYAFAELKRSTQLDALPGSFEAGYRGFIRYRYLYPSTDLNWAKKICVYGPSFTHDNSTYTVITISNNFGYMRRCIHEEILQSLGLRYDTVKYWESIISVGSDGHKSDFSETASSYDLLYLRVLYDHRLKNGMERQEVSRIVPEIIRDLRPNAHLKPDPCLIGFRCTAMSSLSVDIKPKQ